MKTTTRAPPVTEAAFQEQVLELLRLYGWVVFVDRVAFRSDPGYPDITAINVAQRRCIWCELKTETGKLTPRQESWRDTLLAAGLEWYCWRPSSWASAVRAMAGEPAVLRPTDVPRDGHALRGEA